MNEKPQIEIKCLKPDSSVTIEVPSSIHYRIQSLLLSGLPFKDVETLQKSLSAIRNSETDPDPQTYHMRTLLWLLSKIEEEAEKQGKIELKKMDLGGKSST